MKDIKQKAARLAEHLQQAVLEELEWKAQIGQYAVIERDGEVVRIKADEIRELLKAHREKASA